MEQIELKIKSRHFAVEFIKEDEKSDWLLVREIAPNGASIIVYNGEIKGFCEFFSSL